MYQSISCVQTGVQEGSQRFPAIEAPRMKRWRCDLTALSHVYNLYFVACNDEIWVYEPSFPLQTLGEPAWILTVPASGVPAPPGIDDVDPHSITRICVDFLGNEEVILCTCDDGDMAGWRVREIYREIRDHPAGQNDSESEPRYFEHHNLGCSAWGLAIHRNARLIAISANTHLVRVVAYALVEADEPSHGPKDFSFPRHQNLYINLRAQSNIPSVSFDNSGADPTGKWLTSSSIDGLTHLWDISRPDQPARIIAAVGFCANVLDSLNSSRICKCIDRHSVPHAAWGAMYINPWSCHQVDSLSEACGPGIKSNREIPFRKPCFWDITDTQVQFHWKASSHAAASNANDSLEDTDDDLQPFHEVPISDDSDTETTDSMTGVVYSTTDTIQSLTDTVHLTTGTEPSTPETIHPTTPSHDAQTMETATTLITIGDIQESWSPQIQPGYADSFFGSLEDDDTESVTTDVTTDGSIELVTHPNHTHGDDDYTDSSSESIGERYYSIHRKYYCDFTSTMPVQDAAEERRPFIIVTKEEIYLFQRPIDPKYTDRRTKKDCFRPVLSMRNPLYPRGSWERSPILPNGGNIFMYHRQCFTTQIPELGVFIIGSPTGRVGIFRLTRTKCDSADASELFGFRLDHLLPLKKRDGNYVVNDVWRRQLVGVAVGPVQGMLDMAADGESPVVNEGRARRWRLMMYYHDNTVYSYELGKFEQEGPVGLEELVV